MRIDLHTHSNISDGTDSPTMLVNKAQLARLDMIALTDHDTMAGISEAAAAGQRVGVRVVPGIEVSSKLAGKSVHLLGYGVDLTRGRLADELTKMRISRFERVSEILDKLAALGIEISADDVARHSLSAHSYGRPHVADAMIEKGVVTSRQQAFDEYLTSGRPAFVPRYTISLGDGIDMVHESGGVAVLAHPGIRGVSELIKGDVLAKLVSERGLDGIEVDYPLHDAQTRDYFHTIGGRLGLLRTGSSDYHGKGKVGHELGCELTRESAWLEIAHRIEEYGGLLPY